MQPSGACVVKEVVDLCAHQDRRTFNLISPASRIAGG
jgi:hypothetical protein